VVLTEARIGRRRSGTAGPRWSRGGSALSSNARRRLGFAGCSGGLGFRGSRATDLKGSSVTLGVRDEGDERGDRGGSLCGRWRRGRRDRHVGPDY
jgi:hypothetical protein